MDPFLCIGRISGYVERKHVERLGGRIIRIWDCKEILGGN